MSRIEWTSEQVQKIKELYINEKIGCRTIGKQFNVSEQAIRNLLKKENIPIRSLKEANSSIQNLTEEEKDKIVYNYTVLKQGLATAGKSFGCTQYKTTQLLKERGIQLRSYVEAKDALRIYEVNDDYFKVQSPNMAYILGLLASDGSVAKKENGVFIELKQEDGYLLELINKEVNNTRPIKYYTTNTNKKLAKFQVWSSTWKKDLAIYNIVPVKTFILQPPTFLKSEYIKDFIRGYFDGDGCIYLKDHGGCVQFDGASLDMIKWIRTQLGNLYGISTSDIVHYFTENNQSMYRLSYYRKSILQKFYSIFYNNDSSLYLIRKKEKFKTILE